MKLLKPFTIPTQYNVLNRTVTISLLVRQQLERIDQVFTQTLRYRVRFEDLCLSGTDSCLYHQQPVGRSPFIFFSTDCAPPTAVLQEKTVAVWAQI